jgi:hypothetical protein
MCRWRGSLFQIGKPSDKEPGGCLGHRLIITKRVAEEIVANIVGTWIGMEHTGHYNHVKVGKIDSAKISRGCVIVSGIIDQKNIIPYLESNTMFLSVELKNVMIKNMRAEYYETTGFEYKPDVPIVSGVAIVHQPAFKTSFKLLKG